MSESPKVIRPAFSKALFFNFHGELVELRTECDLVREALRRDFSLFVAEPPQRSGRRITVTCRRTVPPLAAVPELVSCDIAPRRVVYRTKTAHWISYYQGEALAKWDFEANTGEIWSENEALLHELAYLLILSRVGEAHDRRGLHRVHASAVAFGGRAALFVAPCGTGKTTLVLEAMKLDGACFLSDDMPLVTATGRILPFPSRLGVRTASVAGEGARRVRREHGEKWLTDGDVFRERICPSASPELLVFALRKLNGAGTVRKVGKVWAFRQLATALIAGVGVPQVVEYFLRFSLRDTVVKTGILFSRVRAAIALVSRSKTFALELGPDLEANLDVFTALLHRSFADAGPAASSPPEAHVSLRR